MTGLRRSVNLDRSYGRAEPKKALLRKGQPMNTDPSRPKKGLAVAELVKSGKNQDAAIERAPGIYESRGVGSCARSISQRIRARRKRRIRPSSVSDQHPLSRRRRSLCIPHKSRWLFGVPRRPRRSRQHCCPTYNDRRPARGKAAKRIPRPASLSTHANRTTIRDSSLSRMHPPVSRTCP